MAKINLSLKLLVDEKNNKVLFAETGKDFVDFLFHLMSLPVATIVKLLNATNTVGCIGELYKSIESLSSDYLLSSSMKDSVLNPKNGPSVPLLSLSDTPTSHDATKNFYICSKQSCGNNNGYSYDSFCGVHEYVTDVSGQICPQCNSSMTKAMTYVVPKGAVAPPISNKGYVKDVVTYMVLDHLAVKPMSTISGITLINEFGVKDISSLVEKQVQVTLNEGVAILKASLETRAVLSTVFLGKKI